MNPWLAYALGILTICLLQAVGLCVWWYLLLRETTRPREALREDFRAVRDSIRRAKAPSN